MAGVYRRSSNGLTIRRQPSKDAIFNRQPTKMQFKINRQKVSRCFKSYYFSWSWQNSGSLRISKLEKPVLLPKNTPSRQYSILQPAYIWKYFEIW